VCKKRKRRKRGRRGRRGKEDDDDHDMIMIKKNIRSLILGRYY
jgi:hypothetical protein